MSKKYNTISFCREDYKDSGEYDEFSMWSDIQEFLRIAVKNGYQMKIWDDGMTIVIEYNFQDWELSGADLVWLDEDEEDENNTES